MADLAVPRRGPGERRAEHGSRKNPMLSGLSHSPNYKYLVLGTVGIGIFGSVVDYGSVNIALPTIADHFETDIPTVQWVVIAYTLTISALLLPMGRLSDLVGRKEDIHRRDDRVHRRRLAGGVVHQPARPHRGKDAARVWRGHDPGNGNGHHHLLLPL